MNTQVPLLTLNRAESDSPAEEATNAVIYAIQRTHADMLDFSNLMAARAKQPQKYMRALSRRLKHMEATVAGIMPLIRKHTKETANRMDQYVLMGKRSKNSTDATRKRKRVFVPPWLPVKERKEIRERARLEEAAAANKAAGVPVAAGADGGAGASDPKSRRKRTRA